MVLPCGVTGGRQVPTTRGALEHSNRSSERSTPNTRAICRRAVGEKRKFLIRFMKMVNARVTRPRFLHARAPEHWRGKKPRKRLAHTTTTPRFLLILHHDRWILPGILSDVCGPLVAAAAASATALALDDDAFGFSSAHSEGLWMMRSTISLNSSVTPTAVLADASATGVPCAPQTPRPPPWVPSVSIPVVGVVEGGSACAFQFTSVQQALRADNRYVRQCRRGRG